jgi:hypothetical protein
MELGLRSSTLIAMATINFEAGLIEIGKIVQLLGFDHNCSFAITNNVIIGITSGKPELDQISFPIVKPDGKIFVGGPSNASIFREIALKGVKVD